jgi:protein O-GlcNAc transferase
MLDTLQILQRGFDHHRAGDLSAAQALYHQVLAAEPNHVDALHLVGLVAYQTGAYQSAVEWIARAVALRDDRADLQANLGESYRALGKLAEAESHLRRALSIDPTLADAHNSLGNVFYSRGMATEAVVEYQRAIAIRPELAEAHNNLGTALKALGDASGAISHYRRATELKPGYAVALNNLGLALQAQTDLDGAGAAFGEAVRVEPSFAEAMSNLARVMELRGRFGESLEWCAKALSFRPDLVAAHVTRANVFRVQKMVPEAVACFQRALDLCEDCDDAYNGLAMVYLSIDRMDDALECCRKGLKHAKWPAALYANMSTALQQLGRVDEAIAVARKAVELDVTDPAAHSNLLYRLNFHPAYGAEAIFAEHLFWAQRHAEPLSAQAPARRNSATADRRLRLGYVSPYFRDHAVNFFVEPVIAAHDHRAFEVFCYSDVAHPDHVTRRLSSAADHWRETRYQSDERLAQIIRDDKIDILVDLTGHIADHRLLAFARRPAPVQVTYLGYQNTTGMSAMDYRLTDASADPPGLTDRFYTERLVRLPRCFFCYQPSDEAPPVSPLPSLESGSITFGSFNNFAKVAPPVIDAWLEILAQVPGSRLLVLASASPSLRARFDNLAIARSIDPGRIVLHAKRPRREYFQLLAQADIALDPFPFNGHTTTCDSIWLGVPVVMMQGQTYASRFGGSVLTNVGLEHLIASSVEQYIAAAVRMASTEHRAALAQLRLDLRPRMARSVLLDFPGFTRELECAYRTMWQTWCSQQA